MANDLFQGNSVLLAADNHNYAVGDRSWFDTAVDGVTDAVQYGLPSAIASGVLSMANTGIKAYNWASGDDVAAYKTSEVLAGFDQDMAQYYEQHQEIIDTVGFIGTSIVPGMLGVKALRAVQAGNNIPFISKALGLLGDAEGASVAAAVNSVKTAEQTFGVINRATAVSLAKGVGQAALETAAWETAVVATMNQAPIFSEMDMKDMLYNSGLNVLVGGVLGGAISGASTLYKVKKAGAEFDAATYHLRETGYLGEAEHGSLNLQNLRLTEIAANSRTGLSDVETQLLANTNSKRELLKLQAANSLTGGDVAVSKNLVSMLNTLENEQDIVGNFAGLKAVTRFTPAADDATAKVLQSKTSLIWDSEQRTFVTREAVVPTVADLLPKEAGVQFYKDSVRIVNAESGRRLTQFPDMVMSPAPSTPYLQMPLREVELYNMWAAKAAPSLSGVTVEANNIPMLEAALRQGAVGEKGVQIALTESLQGVGEMKTIRTFASTQELGSFIDNTKYAVATQLLQEGKSVEEVVRRANVTREWLEVPTFDKATRVRPDNIDAFLQPRHLDMEYAVNNFPRNPRFELENFVTVEQQRKMVQVNKDAVFASLHGEDSTLLPDAEEVLNLSSRANRNGVGASLIGFTNSDYGSFGSLMERIGSWTNKQISNFQDRSLTRLNPHLLEIRGNQQLSDELVLVTNRMRSLPANYVLDAAGSKFVREDVALAAVKGETRALNTLDSAIAACPETIDLSEQIAKFFDTHQQLNATRRSFSKQFAQTAGFADTTALENAGLSRFYIPPVDVRKYPYFAFVRDSSERIGATSHTSMIVAGSPEELAKKISTVKDSFGDSVQVITKKGTKEYFQALGTYEYSRGLNENFIDSTLKRKGVMGERMPAVGSQASSQSIVEDYINFHNRMDAKLVRDSVEHRYMATFAELQQLGSSYTDVATSKIQNVSQAMMDASKNPYNDYIKTALDISKFNEYPMWTQANEWVERTASTAFNKLRSSVEAIKAARMTDSEWTAAAESANRIADQIGLGTPYTAQAMKEFADIIPNKPVLSRFIAKAQSILSGLVLGADPINAMNNLVGANVLYSSEAKYVINAIKNSNSEAVGKLAEIAHIGVPGTNGTASILAPSKLMANSIQRMFSENGQQLMDYYKKLGVVIDEVQMQRQIVDKLAITGGETSAVLNARVQDALEMFRKVTGNKAAESFNRFLAADAMKQLTDIAVGAGKMTEREASAYIQTFVNRTQGNFLASQRPIIFQGAIGQAISLFQTYQFNLLQQLFRYTGSGQGKATAALLGMQASLYGLQGLPAFNAINTHLIGNAYGNPEHKDIYSTVFSSVDKELGNWLMYGLGSNALGLVHPDLTFNLYSRGDINPRTLTVLPNTLMDIPVVKTSVGFVGNILGTANKIAQGGDVTNTVLQGIEHANINRPLAGLAQVIQGAATTSAGKLISAVPTETFGMAASGNLAAALDGHLLSNFVRIAGAKPLDDSVALDAQYRMKAYQARDVALRNSLGEVVRSKYAGGASPTEEDLNQFALEYAKAGGNMKNFSAFIAKNAMATKESVVNETASHLNKPLSRNLQKIMGGRELLESGGLTSLEEAIPQE